MRAEQNVIAVHSVSDWTDLELWLQLANINYWVQVNRRTARLRSSNAEGAIELDRGAAAVAGPQVQEVLI